VEFNLKPVQCCLRLCGAAGIGMGCQWFNRTQLNVDQELEHRPGPIMILAAAAGSAWQADIEVCGTTKGYGNFKLIDVPSQVQVQEFSESHCGPACD
jgi:hypothetical protein